MGLTSGMEGFFKHECEEPGCDKIVIFDIEPNCFEHSSWLRDHEYSARAKAEENNQMATETKPTRTIIEFAGTEILQTLSLPYTIPNVVVGQLMAFDHPSLGRNLNGRVINIQHTVFLGPEPPITYIDVAVES